MERPEKMQNYALDTEQEVNLRNLTSFRIGGRPSLYARPTNYEQLTSALEKCRRDGLPFKVLGGGSNILVDDGELDFAVIHICAPTFEWINRKGSSLRVGAGVRIAGLLRECERLGLGGLEFMAGIPGTTGGAVAGNAGAWDGAIGDKVMRLWCVDESGDRQVADRKDLEFGYRRADVPGRIITEVELQLNKCDPPLVKDRITRNLSKKRARQPTTAPNAGCVFQNPENDSAGRLLDRCDLKGARVGGAEVSDNHANFICNTAGARAGEVLELIETMRARVKSEFGIELELELKHWNDEATAA